MDTNNYEPEFIDWPMINRGVITIVPKQPYYDWGNALYPNITMGPEDQQEHNAYLISDDFSIDNLDQVVKKRYKSIFEHELFGIHTDPDGWPQDRSFKVFKQWFHYYISSVVLDLEQGRITKEYF